MTTRLKRMTGDDRAVIAAAVGWALMAWSSGALAQAPSAALDRSGQCFDLSRHTGLLPLDDHTILTRVGSDIYRITTNRCPGLSRPDPHINVITNGSSFVCGRLDYSLSVGEGGALATTIPCTVRSQRRLTPDEIAALPPNKRP